MLELFEFLWNKKYLYACLLHLKKFIHESLILFCIESKYTIKEYHIHEWYCLRQSLMDVWCICSFEVMHYLYMMIIAIFEYYICCIIQRRCCNEKYYKMDLSYSSDGFASYYERWKLRNKDVIIIRWEEKKMGVEIHILLTIIDMCIILSSDITAFLYTSWCIESK